MSYCCMWQNEDLVNVFLNYPYVLESVQHHFRALSLSCSVQHFKTIGQIKRMFWANEVSWDLGLRWVSDGYLILHSLEHTIDKLYLAFTGELWHIYSAYFGNTNRNMLRARCNIIPRQRTLAHLYEGCPVMGQTNVIYLIRIQIQFAKSHYLNQWRLD